jgi:hypothetical protein
VHSTRFFGKHLESLQLSGLEAVVLYEVPNVTVMVGAASGTSWLSPGKTDKNSTGHGNKMINGQNFL